MQQTVGTAVFETVLVAPRRLAQAHYSARRFGETASRLKPYTHPHRPTDDEVDESDEIVQQIMNPRIGRKLLGEIYRYSEDPDLVIWAAVDSARGLQIGEQDRDLSSMLASSMSLTTGLSIDQNQIQKALRFSDGSLSTSDITSTLRRLPMLSIRCESFSR
jgi:hypothetical protein